MFIFSHPNKKTAHELKFLVCTGETTRVKFLYVRNTGRYFLSNTSSSTTPQKNHNNKQQVKKKRARTNNGKKKE